MAFFGGVFHDFLEGPWEEVRGYLREELEQLRAALLFHWNRAFDKDGFLNANTIEGATTVQTFYISNEGPDGAPKWAKVNLNNGVKLRLRLANFTQADPQTVLGRGSGTGDYQSIALGDALSITAGALDVLVDNTTIQVNGSNQLEVISSSTSSSAGGHLHGLMRILGDGSTTTFNLLDIAEYLEHIGVNGSFADPATFTLSADGSQVTFDAAPGAGQIITMEYVIAQV